MDVRVLQRMMCRNADFEHNVAHTHLKIIGISELICLKCLTMWGLVDEMFKIYEVFVLKFLRRLKMAELCKNSGMPERRPNEKIIK